MKVLIVNWLIDPHLIRHIPEKKKTDDFEDVYGCFSIIKRANETRLIFTIITSTITFCLLSSGHSVFAPLNASTSLISSRKKNYFIMHNVNKQSKLKETICFYFHSLIIGLSTLNKTSKIQISNTKQIPQICPLFNGESDH